MVLPFMKMQGAGNDFVMLNCFDRPFDLTTEEIRRLCHRQFGVGCDQMLVVEKSAMDGVDFKYRIFNQDGGEVQMCGNGARCFAVYVRALGLTDKRKIRCETQKGVIEPEVMDDGRVRVNMGAPRFLPEEIPFDAGAIASLTRADDRLWQIRAGGEDHWLSVLSMGNPHAVKLVGNVDTADVDVFGPAIQAHPAFIEGVNVGFLQILDSAHARLRVYERGVGETLACGTGASAAAVCAMRRGALDSAAEIQMRGGLLKIEWQGGESPVYLTGPAEIVFTGEIQIERKDD